MVPLKSSAVPINSAGTALRAGAKPNFGTNPYTGFSGFGENFVTSPYTGFNAFDPGMTATNGVTFGMRGLSACGCGPVGGCSCEGTTGLSGLGQSSSLDQVISNATSWLTGVAESNLPASASVPPSVGSLGNIMNTLYTNAPYILIAYLAYRLIK